MKFQIIEQENARQQFIEKYGEQIQGVVSGFGPAGNCAKGIADLHRRTEVSQKANDRLLNALASVDDSRTIEELTADIQKHVTWNKLRMRGLRPWTEDKPMLAAINHGEFLINGFRKRDRKPLLYENRGRVASSGAVPQPRAAKFDCCGPMASLRKCLARIATTWLQPVKPPEGQPVSLPAHPVPLFRPALEHFR